MIKYLFLLLLILSKAQIVDSYTSDVNCQVPYDPEVSVILTVQEKEKMNSEGMSETEFCEGLVGDSKPKIQDLYWILECKPRTDTEDICSCIALVDVGTEHEHRSEIDKKCNELRERYK